MDGEHSGVKFVVIMEIFAIQNAVMHKYQAMLVSTQFKVYFSTGIDTE